MTLGAMELCTLLENVADAIVILDQESRILSLNRAAEGLLGLPRDDLLGTPATRLFPPTPAGQPRHGLVRLLTHRRPRPEQRVETRIRHQDGALIPVSIAANTAHLAGGTRFILSFRDITQRKAAEAALRRSEQKYRALLDDAPDAIMLASPQGTLLEANSQAEALLGYSREQLIGKSFAMLHPEGVERERARQHLADIHHFRQFSVHDIVFQHKHGHHITVDVSGRLLELGGKPVIQGIFRDVTTRQRAAEALKASEARYRVLIDTIPHGIEECDRHGVITLGNAAHARMHGHAPGELVGRPTWELAALEEERERLRQELAVCGADNVPPETRELQHRTREGGVITVQRDWTCKHGPQGEVTGFISVITDITQRKLAEQRLQRQQEELAHALRLQTMGEVASTMAHELNQPLAAIANYARGCIRRMQGEHWNAAEILDAVERIDDQAQRAGAITRNLRGFLKKGESHKKVTDLRQVIRNAVHFADFRTRPSGVAVMLNCGEKPLKVLADPIQIQQVVLNVMYNAIEAMAHGPRNSIKVIRLSVQVLEHGMARVDVADSGPGVPAHLREAIFTSFFTTKTEGMGLGLALSRSIIEDHGGSLWLGEPPQGAQFHFTLPIYRDEPS